MTYMGSSCRGEGGFAKSVVAWDAECFDNHVLDQILLKAHAFCTQKSFDLTLLDVYKYHSTSLSLNCWVRLNQPYH